jgi:hypothetical protein
MSYAETKPATRSMGSDYRRTSGTKSGVADLQITGLRRRDRRKQPTMGFEIEPRCAV